MLKKLSLKNTTLVTILFVTTTILIIMGGYYAYVLQEKEIIQNRYNELSAIKELKVNQIIEWRDERTNTAKSIINNPIIINELKNYRRTKNEEVKKEITVWLKLLKESFKYENLILFDKDYNVITSSEESISFDKENNRNKGLFDNENDFNISSLRRDSNGNIYFAFGLKFKEENQVYAYLIINLDPNVFLFKLIQNWPTPSKSAETILVRPEGDSLIFLNELRHQSNTALNFKLPLNRADLPAVQAVKGKSGLYRGVDYRGVNVLSAIGEIPGTNWFIISKIDESEIFTDLQSLLITSIIIIVLLLAVSYLIILRIWRKSKLESLQVEFDLQKDKLRLSNLYATLSQINQAIVREQSRPELLLTISKLPVVFGNFKASALCMLDDNNGQPKIESFAGEFDYFNNILNDNSGFDFEDPSAQSAKEGITKIYNELKEVNNNWQSIALKCGIHSCAASPIKPFGKTIGAFVLYSVESNFFQLPEIRLIEEIASDISFSLETIEKNEQRKKIEQQIEESERRLATLFTNLPGIAYQCKYDNNWTMEFMSEGTLNVTGYSPEEIVDQKIITYDQIIFPEDRNFVWESVKNSVDKNKSFTVVYRITTRDNEIRWVWERGLPVLDTNGNILFIEGFISDITETKEIQDQLQKSEEYFRYLFHNNPIPMWIYELENYRFLEVNQAAIENYGYSKEDFAKMTLYDISPDEEKEKLTENLRQPRSKTSESGEWIHKLKNGKIIDVLVISHKIEFDKKPAVLVVTIDITERKNAALTLIEAKEKAEAGEKLKTDFLAQMSHEIRTPVNVILSFSSLIKTAVFDTIDKDIREGFNSIEHASKRLIRTIDSILNMAQITQGMVDLRPEILDIHKSILLQLLDEFKPIATSKGLKLIIEDTCPSCLVNCDRYSMSQVFANLIDNAIKYTHKGIIKICLDCNDNFVTVSVEDTGIGISKEYMPNLFSPFSQEETGYSRGYEGTGLGLALVKNYCDMNDVQITVTSKKGEGTIFKVKIAKYSN